jgi:hypothetical protein
MAIEPDEWLESISPSSVPQVLSISGQYDYYNPAWSSNSNSLYALKAQGREQGMRLIRIDFTDSMMSGEDTVKNFLKALIMRDDDYAKGLMTSPPDILTISNPKVVGFKILSSGSEGQRQYVEAESYLQYTANPYFQAERSRYYLSQSQDGYKIDEIKKLESKEVLSKDDGMVYYSKTKYDSDTGSPTGQTENTVLFRDSDIPQEYLPKGNYRLTNLYYNSDKKSVLFTVQGVEDGQSLNLLVYDIGSREFRQLGSINNGSGYFLTSDNDFKYGVLDYFMDNDYEKPRTNVYKLDNKSMVSLYELINDKDITSVRSNYWDDGRLIFEVSKDGQTVRYIYHPDKNSIERF